VANIDTVLVAPSTISDHVKNVCMGLASADSHVCLGGNRQPSDIFYIIFLWLVMEQCVLGTNKGKQQY